jgi:hypothetical protein
MSNSTAVLSFSTFKNLRSKGVLSFHSQTHMLAEILESSGKCNDVNEVKRQWELFALTLGGIPHSHSLLNERDDNDNDDQEEGSGNGNAQQRDGDAAFNDAKDDLILEDFCEKMERGADFDDDDDASRGDGREGWWGKKRRDFWQRVYFRKFRYHAPATRDAVNVDADVGNMNHDSIGQGWAPQRKRGSRTEEDEAMRATKEVVTGVRHCKWRASKYDNGIAADDNYSDSDNSESDDDDDDESTWNWSIADRIDRTLAGYYRDGDDDAAVSEEMFTAYKCLVAIHLLGLGAREFVDSACMLLNTKAKEGGEHEERCIEGLNFLWSRGVNVLRSIATAAKKDCASVRNNKRKGGEKSFKEWTTPLFH